jgi:hypothetical protein
MVRFRKEYLKRRNRMQTAKQLSVSLVNKPGRLAAVLDALGKGKVTFRALCVMDSGDRGTVRFVPDDPEAAQASLESLNIRVEAANVLLVDIPSQANAFRNVCERLATEHLNIDYAYLSFAEHGGARGGGVAVIKVNDFAKAQQILRESGVDQARKGPVLHRLLHVR